MELTLFEDYSSSLSAKEIIDYITKITPDESDVPDYFFTLIKKSKKRFFLKELSIEEILSKDPDVKEYVDGKEERYGKDKEGEYEPYPDELDNPIVILNDSVVDGYSRLSTHFHSGEKTIKAYISQ